MIIQRFDRTNDEIIAISQPAHSWLSGQLARNWGNKNFAAFQPSEDICYAAEQHDIGYLDWEKNAILNPATGLPETFCELPAPRRLKVWRTGIEQMRRVSVYAAVLMSRHYCGLSEKYPDQKIDDRRLMKNFCGEQQEFRRELLQNLAGKSDFTAAIAEPTLKYHSLLLAAWDLLSLHLCMNPNESFQVPDVPSSQTEVRELSLAATPGSKRQFSVSPWPFAESALRLRYEGSLLRGTFRAEDELRRALDRATLVLVEVELVSVSA